MRYPPAAPMPNCRSSSVTTDRADSSDPMVRVSIRMIVSIYAIGSLEPLSSSSRGRRLFFNATFWLPRIPKTEAESVDDIVAASNSDGRNAK